MTPEEEARRALHGGTLREGLSPAGQAEYDRLLALVRAGMSGAAAGGMAGERCEGSARGRGSVPVVHHVIYCRGCRRAWVDAEYEAGGWFSMVIGDGCACACVDGDPLYEAWVVDPDPGEIPEGAWES